MSLLSSDTAKGMSDYLINGMHSYYDALAEAKEHNKSLALGARLQYLKNNGSEPIELREMTAELYRIAVICGVSDKELADFLNTQKDKVRYWRERYGIYEDSKKVVFNTTKVSKDAYKHFFHYIKEKEDTDSD